MNIRKFYLTNSIGQSYDLNNTDHMLVDPDGLGSEHKVTYEHIGNDFVTIKDEIKQNKITGTIFFRTYEDYSAFAKFSVHKPMILTYVADSTYQIKVNADKLEKSEKEVGGLYCKVNLVATSLFYKTLTAKNTSDSDGKIYSYIYPYKYSNNAASTISMDIDSEIPAQTKLTIIGPAENPSWKHYCNDDLIADGTVNVSVEEGKRLVVDATSVPYSISLCNNDGTEAEDVYANSDFSTQRFLMLQNGGNTIRISHEGTNAINIILEALELHETV